MKLKKKKKCWDKMLTLTAWCAIILIDKTIRRAYMYCLFMCFVAIIVMDIIFGKR